jgi:hypothetical protein
MRKKVNQIVSPPDLTLDLPDPPGYNGLILSGTLAHVFVGTHPAHFCRYFSWLFSKKDGGG